MKQLKKLAGDTAIYGISSIVGRVLNYLLFPLHTMVFLTGSYGIITELYVYAAFFTVIYAFGLETSFFRFSTKLSEHKSDVFNVAISYILILSFVIGGILIAFDTSIVHWMQYDGSEHFIWIFAGILGLDAIQAIPFARLRIERKAKWFAIARISGIMVNILINVFFLGFCFGVDQGSFFPEAKSWIYSVYSPEYHLEYVFIANLLASLTSGLFLLPYFMEYRWSLKKSILVPMLKFGYPLVITGLAIVTNEMLSRMALKYWLPEGFYEGYTSQDILGVFGGVYKLAMLMTIGIQAFRYAAEPFFFAISDDKDSPNVISKLLTWFTIFGCVVWIGVSINLDILQFLLRNPDYRLAIPIVPMLLLAALFSGINYNLSAWYKLIDQTAIGTKITLIGAAITIAGNYFLIPIFGYTGSAIASVVSYGVMCLVSYIWSRNLNPIPYEFMKLIIMLITSYLFIQLTTVIPFNGILLILVRNLLLLVLIYLVWRFEKSQSKPI